MSRREKFRRQQEQSFVGRSGELAVFEANLRRDTEADDFRFLFHVRGQSGVGKSTLVRRWKGYAERVRAATVLLDDAVHGPLEAMKAISDQLDRQGLSMDAFTKRLGDFRQRQKAAEHALPPSEGSPGAKRSHTPASPPPVPCSVSRWESTPSPDVPDRRGGSAGTGGRPGWSSTRSAS